MKTHFLLLLFLMNGLLGYSQSEDEQLIKQIFDNVLTNEDAYNNLEYLCTNAPGRLIGSEESLIAQKYMKEYFEELGVDRVFYQEFTSPAWKCDSAVVSIISEDGQIIQLATDALGPSSATTAGGIEAEVIEVNGLKEVEDLGREKIEGKIIFYNRPWDPTFIRTFGGYSAAVNQRARGPAKAAEYGAVGVIVRSVTNAMDHHPHTGSTRYDDKLIPAVAIATLDADLLSQQLKENPKLKVQLFVDAEEIEETKTYNLIAEITGTEKPEEFIVVAGHIDAWHNTPGAHDDGAGCVQAADVVRIFKELGIENKRTIRAVMYMDEELYQSGGKAYADAVGISGEKHLLAMEADGGGFTPRMFTVNASEEVVKHISSFQPLLQPYGIDEIKAGWGGVDIGPLKQYGIPLVGYGTDSQRYFDMHHSPNDTFDNINFRELQLGSGCMASLVYLIDKYGVE
jgi:Zn-dependent M28 family amino/carboxypeptidase